MRSCQHEHLLNFLQSASRMNAGATRTSSRIFSSMVTRQPSCDVVGRSTTWSTRSARTSTRTQGIASSSVRISLTRSCRPLPWAARHARRQVLRPLVSPWSMQTGEIGGAASDPRARRKICSTVSGWRLTRRHRPQGSLLRLLRSLRWFLHCLGRNRLGRRLAPRLHP